MIDTVQVKAFLKLVAVPLGLLILFSVYLGVYNLLQLPDPTHIIELAKAQREHSAAIVFWGAIGEGLLMFNLYFPGSVMIILGITMSRGDPVHAIFLVFLVIAALFIDVLINYALGRFGWYQFLVRFGLNNALEKARIRIQHKGLSVLFWTYMHPNLSALTATSCGILRVPFRTFTLYSFIALVFWNVSMGIVVYIGGEQLMKLATVPVFIGLLTVWIIFQGVNFVLRKRTG